MAEALNNFSLRISDRQIAQIKELAECSHSTPTEIIREACRQFARHAADLKKNERILKKSSALDLQLIVFPGRWSEESKNRMKIYLHKSAVSDMADLGKTVEDDVMEFLTGSVADKSILHKGQIITNDEGLTFICFRVNVVKVYCSFSPVQLTVLSVEG